MKKTIAIVLLATLSVQAQQVQWASKLIKYSSDLGGKQNGIKRILGRPDAFPQGGPSPNAWTPKNALDGREIVEVGFENPQLVKQIAVFENLNAGCVTRIQVDTGTGKYETVWARKMDRKTPFYSASIPADRKYYYNRKRRKIQTAPDVSVNSGIEYAILEAPVSNVVAVRVEFSFALLPGPKQIDAIGISDSADPILPQVNTKPVFENLASPEIIPVTDWIPSNPVVSSDGNKLFFTSSKSEKEYLFSCTKQNGKWQSPVAEHASLSANDNYNFIEYASSDFVLKGGVRYQRGSGESGYEFLVNRNGSYEPDGVLKITAYNNYDETSEATITADRKTIILGIESDLNQGGADLYFAQRKDDGSYGFLQNMGKIVNSAGDESMPQLLSDQKTLLFSSNGFSSYGDYDIYVTQRLDDSWKKWSAPVNLGSKVNSGGFDGLPFYDEKSETLYFTRAIDGENTLQSIRIPLQELLKTRETQ